MTVTVKHSKTNAISDWTQAQLDEQIALGNFPAGTTLANIVLPSDWNNDHTLTGVGTMAEQDANSVAITGGAIDETTIGATTASTGKFTTLEVVNAGANSGLTLLRNTDSSTNSTRLFFDGSGGTTAIYNSANSILFNTSSTIGVSSGNNQFRVAPTGSAVNYVQVTGSATTARPVISTQGSDSNIGLDINAKGTSDVTFRSGTSATFQAIMNSGGDSWLAANRMTGLANLTATSASASNVAISLQTKGTGAIDLAAGSSGVNISNGGTVTAITRTAQGSAYTSAPTVAITAPTTAGGVQATASSFINMQGTQTVVSGGTGYTLNDVLTIVGGTRPGGAATLTVTGVSGGVITSVSVTAAANYTTAPTNPASVTGGTGSGATFTLAWGLSTTFTITNSGSGYIEQPTITFSGGGGSGAAAYATVGSGTIIRSLGSTGSQSLDFYTPSSITALVPAFRIRDTSGDSYLMLQNQSTTALMVAQGNANANIFLCANGGGSVSFRTQGGSQVEQMRVSNTTSAVNYVQVTGAATGNRPAISVQGSDTNINMDIVGKGFSRVFVLSANARAAEFTYGTATSIASNNWIKTIGNAGGTAPVIASDGTDTNIDLALTPKGTGVLRFGTYTANMALTVQGYIEIKDSGGTLRKLAVIA